MKKFFMAVGLLAAMACDNSKSTVKQEQSKDEVNELKKEVMEVHDHTMAQMNIINKLKRQLKEKWRGDEVADTMVYYQSYVTLQKSNDKMMNWMKYFSRNYDDNMEEEAKRKFLEKEKIKVMNLAEYTDKSIKEARLLLAE